MLTATITTICATANDQTLTISTEKGTFKMVRVDPLKQPSDGSRPIPANLLVLQTGVQLAYNTENRREAGPFMMDFEEDADVANPRLVLSVQVTVGEQIGFKCEVPGEVTLEVALAGNSNSILTYPREGGAPAFKSA